MTTIENKDNLASHYALQVALQTMKERCQNLQHRLTSVEDENLRLRMISGIDKPDNTMRGSDANDKYGLNELEVLRDKVAELTRQKVQLTEHIAMIATENRQLWSRLSKLTKDNHNLGKIKDNPGISTVSSNSSSNCLIRSKTFTQSSPNPALRTKLNTTEYEDSHDEDDTDNVKVARNNDEFNNTLGFGYLQDQEIDDDTVQNIKRITEALQEYKKEILWQQSDLKVLLGNLQKHKDLDNKRFVQQQQQKEKLMKTIKNETQILKVDKCLETEPVSIVAEKPQPPNRPNLEEQLDLFKQNADNIDKMCPMCGKVFTKQTQFPEFQEHVELHFIDDSEHDYNSIDRNFEIISHTVGDF